jgi:hypothetical protein
MTQTYQGIYGPAMGVQLPGWLGVSNIYVFAFWKVKIKLVTFIINQKFFFLFNQPDMSKNSL